MSCAPSGVAWLLYYIPVILVLENTVDVYVSSFKKSYENFKTIVILLIFFSVVQKFCVMLCSLVFKK